MPSTKELRRRIRSVKSTAQITKAMQMVAATKMRRAQNQALGGRPYSETLQLALTELMPAIDRSLNPLLRSNSSQKIGVLLLTTDKSLCGALNANVLRLAQQFYIENIRHSRPDRESGLETDQTDSRIRKNDVTMKSDSLSSLRGVQPTKQSHTTRTDIEFFTIGKKGRDFVVKTGKNLNADFENNDLVQYKTAKTVANFIIQSFLEEKIGEVYVLYPDFVSTLKQDPKLEKILPISQEELLKGLNLNGLDNTTRHPGATSDKQSYSANRIRRNLNAETDSITRQHSLQNDTPEFIFDTSKSELLDFVLTHFVQQKIYQSMLETKASEHSARMIAMKNATDSAKDLVSDLQLAYNQTRQEGITRELLEITSALAALE